MVFRALRERARRASCQLDGQGALRFKLYALRSTVYELVLKLSSFSFSLVCILLSYFIIQAPPTSYAYDSNQRSSFTSRSVFRLPGDISHNTSRSKNIHLVPHQKKRMNSSYVCILHSCFLDAYSRLQLVCILYAYYAYYVWILCTLARVVCRVHARTCSTSSCYI